MVTKNVLHLAFEVINCSILSCLFSDKLLFGYMKTHHLFAVFMNSRGKRFANISENKTNANKTSFTVIYVMYCHIRKRTRMTSQKTEYFYMSES